MSKNILNSKFIPFSKYEDESGQAIKKGIYDK